MLRFLPKKFSNIVAPPFLYGTRNPLVAGIIRTNDEISNESKRVLDKFFFQRNPFVTQHVDVDAHEVVSDDSVHRAHDPTHLEGGVGITLTTKIKLPKSKEEIPCAVVVNCTHVGVRNDFKNYHANQARVVCQAFAEKNLGDRGIVFSVTDNDQSVGDGYLPITRLHKVDPKSQKINSHQYSVEPISHTEKAQIFSQYNTFPSLMTAVENFALIDKKSDSIICGISRIPETNKLTDPFVTLDCPEGNEKSCLGQLVSEVSRSRSAILEVSESDRVIFQLFGSETSGLVVHALPIGLTSEEQTSLLRGPLCFSGMLHHMFDPVDYS